MPVSIEIYRCRIGQFQSNKHSINIKYKQKSYSQKKKPNLLSIIIRIALLMSMVSLSSTWSPNLTQPAAHSPAYTATLTQPGHEERVPPPPAKNHNFLARYKFGNRGQKKGGITIMHALE